MKQHNAQQPTRNELVSFMKLIQTNQLSIFRIRKDIQITQDRWAIRFESLNTGDEILLDANQFFIQIIVTEKKSQGLYGEEYYEERREEIYHINPYTGGNELVEDYDISIYFVKEGSASASLSLDVKAELPCFLLIQDFDFTASINNMADWISSQTPALDEKRQAIMNHFDSYLKDKEEKETTKEKETKNCNKCNFNH